jgi:hypothetical protein
MTDTCEMHLFSPDIVECNKTRDFAFRRHDVAKICGDICGDIMT